MLDSIFQRCSPSEDRLLERTCRALRIGIKVAGKATDRMLPMLLEVLPQRFRQTRHSAFL